MIVDRCERWGGSRVAAWKTVTGSPVTSGRGARRERNRHPHAKTTPLSIFTERFHLAAHFMGNAPNTLCFWWVMQDASPFSSDGFMCFSKIKIRKWYKCNVCPTKKQFYFFFNLAPMVLRMYFSVYNVGFASYSL